jgi:hypothetical protein
MRAFVLCGLAGANENACRSLFIESHHVTIKESRWTLTGSQLAHLSATITGSYVLSYLTFSMYLLGAVVVVKPVKSECQTVSRNTVFDSLGTDYRKCFSCTWFSKHRYCESRNYSGTNLQKVHVGNQSLHKVYIAGSELKGPLRTNFAWLNG